MKDQINNLFVKRNENIKKIIDLPTSGNKTFFVETENNKYVLRLCGERSRYRSKEQIIAEIELLNHLKEKGFLVPNMIEFEGTKVISINGKNGICYEYINGAKLEEINELHCFEVGKILARIHEITLNFKFPYERKKWNLETIKFKLEEVKEDFLIDPILSSKDFYSRLKTQLDNINFSNELSEGAIHEDLGIRHILFNEGVIVGILDWDRSYNGKLILDLGQTIRGWCFEDWKLLNGLKLKKLLEGYSSIRPLNGLEKENLKNAIKFAFLERIISFAIFGFTENKMQSKINALEELEVVENLYKYNFQF